MKFSHAAPLALVGWYPMIPPATWLSGPENSRPDGGAPLSQWQIWASYDTAKQCESAKAKLRQQSHPEQFDGFLVLAMCIGTDDPSKVGHFYP